MGMDIATLSIACDSRPLADAKKQMEGLSKTGMGLESVLKKVVGAFGLFKLGQFVKDTTLLTARYETMGVVVNVVGNNAGYAAKQMAAFQADLQKAGISAMESRNTLATMAQAHIDLARSSDLARVAQDAAVIGQMNSSEAFQRMIYGIQSGQVEILRTIGLNVNFEQSYAKLGLTLGKNAKDLTETEKTLARTNAVMEKAPDIAGVYSGAMGTAGKQLYSMKRYSDDLQLSWGALFTPALGTVIGALNQGFKDMKDWTQKNKDEMGLLGGAIGGTVGQMIDLGKATAGLFTDSMEGADGFLFLRRTVQGVGGVIALVTDDITALRVALLDWAYVSMSSMESTLGSIIAVSKMIPSSLFVGNKAEIMAGMGYAKTYLNVSSTMAKQRANEISMQPLATENWMNGLDQVDKAKAWKDNVTPPKPGGGGGGTGGSSKASKASYDWNSEATAAARYAAEQRKEQAEWYLDETVRKFAEQNKELNKLNTELFGDMTSTVKNWSSEAKNALTDFVTTGKADFKGMISDWIMDLARLSAQQGFKAMAGGMKGSSTSWISSLGSLLGGTFADGGSPPVGKVSLVGERGPELFVPRTAGTIVPNNAMGSSVSVVNNISISSSGQVDVKSQAGNMQALGTLMANTCRQVIASEQRAGGLLNPA